MMLCNVIAAASKFGTWRVGRTLFVFDARTVTDIMHDQAHLFRRCAGPLGACDDMATILATRSCHVSEHIINDEITTLLRSICLTCVGGIRDDSFDANVVASDTAGHIVMRTLLQPALFDVGTMNRDVDALLNSVVKHHVMSALLPWRREGSEVRDAYDKVGSTARLIGEPASFSLGDATDARADALATVWYRNARTLASAIAWLLYEWASDINVRRLDPDVLIERILSNHPPIWWEVRCASLATRVARTPIDEGNVKTFAYVPVNAGDTVIMLLPQCDCINYHLVHSALRTLIMQLGDQRIDLTIAPGASRRTHFGSVLMPARPLLSPKRVQA